MTKPNSNIQEELKKHLLLFEPECYLSSYVKNVRDIYNNKSFLKKLPCTDTVVNKISNLIVSAIEINKRFRQLDCLKILRAIIKDRHEQKLSQETVSLLFAIYKHYIFDHREEVQWCVSALLRGRKLKDSELSWIIKNYKQSDHLVNRLLRYPADNPSVFNWASELYNKGGIKGRNSELLGLLIRNGLPNNIKKETKETIIWAVFYSRASTNIKIDILEANYSEKNLKSFIEVCMRLRLPLAIKNVLKKRYG